MGRLTSAVATFPCPSTHKHLQVMNTFKSKSYRRNWFQKIDKSQSKGILDAKGMCVLEKVTTDTKKVGRLFKLIHRIDLVALCIRNLRKCIGNGTLIFKKRIHRIISSSLASFDVPSFLISVMKRSERVGNLKSDRDPDNFAKYSTLENRLMCLEMMSLLNTWNIQLLIATQKI